MKEQNEYTKQAEDFLNRNNLKMRITLSDSKTAPWGPTGHHYRVTVFKRVMNLGQRITFDFWGSVNDMRQGIEPSYYDVLACISGDVNGSESFEDFCNEYGYDNDSIKALQTYRRLDKFATRLREFLTSEEIEQLQEIQ
jgi:hypothetical protein